MCGKKRTQRNQLSRPNRPRTLGGFMGQADCSTCASYPRSSPIRTTRSSFRNPGKSGDIALSVSSRRTNRHKKSCAAARYQRHRHQNAALRCASFAHSKARKPPSVAHPTLYATLDNRGKGGAGNRNLKTTSTSRPFDCACVAAFVTFDARLQF